MKSNTVRAIACGVAAVVVLAMVTAMAQAGPIFFAGEWKDGNLLAATDFKGPCFTIRYSTAQIVVTAAPMAKQAALPVARGAKIEISETVLGPVEGERPAVCVIPLPVGTKETDVDFDADLHAPTVSVKAPDAEAVRVKAQFLPAADAQKVYEGLARGSGTVAICSCVGRPALFIPAIKLLPKQEVQFSFRQAVTEAAGVFEVQCVMPAAGLSRGPVAQVSLTVKIGDALPLRTILSPTHEIAVKREGLREAAVTLSAKEYAGGDDFRLLYVADEDPLGLRAIAHRAEGEDEGYFLLVGNPTGQENEKPLPKDVLFVLDTSGSMRGEKIEQARAAIDYCLGKLGEGDRFNIITFATEVRPFRKDLVERSAAELKAARQFIDETVANGQTNIGAALAQTLAAGATQGRPRIVIFLTDGVPTAGELVPDEIVKKVSALLHKGEKDEKPVGDAKAGEGENVSGAAGAVAANGATARIFVVGVGNDVNAHLLDKIAETSGGGSEYVGPEEEIDVKVAALYNRLSSPVLEDVALAMGELKTGSVYPARLPTLYKGEQVVIAGRYKGGGKHTFTLSGTVAGEKRQFRCEADLPQGPRPQDDFVAVLWATRKIGFLLQEIRLHGENKELVEEIVRLSKRFGVVTEYTQFIAAARPGTDNKLLAEEAARNMKEAHSQQAGQWAVQQAINDSRLQNAVVMNNASNGFRDRGGRMQEAQNVSQLGRRAFYYRDGQWQDSEEAGDRKKRIVKLYSAEYFELLKSNADFAKAQSVGWNVSMNVGAERIEVEKDGKTSEPVASPSPAPAPDNQSRFADPLKEQQLNQQMPRPAPVQQQK